MGGGIGILRYILKKSDTLPEGFQLVEESSRKCVLRSYSYPLDGVYPLFGMTSICVQDELFGIAKNKDEMTRRLHNYLERYAKENLKCMEIKDETGLAAKVIS